MRLWKEIAELFMTPNQLKRRDQQRAANARSYRKKKRNRELEIIKIIENVALEAMRKKPEEEPG